MAHLRDERISEDSSMFGDFDGNDILKQLYELTRENHVKAKNCTAIEQRGADPWHYKVENVKKVEKMEEFCVEMRHEFDIEIKDFVKFLKDMDKIHENATTMFETDQINASVSKCNNLLKFLERRRSDYKRSLYNIMMLLGKIGEPFPSLKDVITIKQEILTKYGTVQERNQSV